MEQVFDLRNQDEIVIYRENKEQSFEIGVRCFNETLESKRIDTSYSLTLSKTNQSSVSKVFVLGTDLIIDNLEVKVLIDNTIGSGEYKGVLKSQSQDIAYSINIPIKIITNE